MRALLTEWRFPFVEEEKMAGHRIDFVVAAPWGRLGVDVNGDRWHSWPKIVDCDRVKLDRVFAAGDLVLGIWWSRLQRSPVEVAFAIAATCRMRMLPCWDWCVDPSSLSAESWSRVRSLEAVASGQGWRLTSAESGSRGGRRTSSA